MISYLYGGRGGTLVCDPRLDPIAWSCLIPPLTKRKRKGKERARVESSHTLDVRLQPWKEDSCSFSQSLENEREGRGDKD